MDNSTVATVFGTAGAVCWSIQLLPQIWKNQRHRSTAGLHPVMYLSWAVAGIPLGVYNVVSGLNMALQVQPHLLILLSLVAWAQCQYFGPAAWSPARIALGGAAAAAGIGAVEVGLVLALRRAAARRLAWPATLLAVLAAVLLAVGVLRYYVEIARARGPQNVSFAFVAVDYAGDLTSIVAVVFAPRLDILALVVYSVEGVLWTGILLLGAHYRLRPWLRAKMRAPAEKNDGAVDEPLGHTRGDTGHGQEVMPGKPAHA